MAPTQKGTKSGKQIMEEFRSTRVFYRNRALISACILVTIIFAFFGITIVTTIISIIFVIIVILAYKFVVFIAEPDYTEPPAVLDNNRDGAIAASLIVVASGALLATLLSDRR